MEKVKLALVVLPDFTGIVNERNRQSIMLNRGDAIFLFSWDSLQFFFFFIWLEFFLTLLWFIGSACIWKWKLSRKCSSLRVLIKFLPITDASPSTPTHTKGPLVGWDHLVDGLAINGAGLPIRWTAENDCYIKCGSSAQGVFSRPFALRINWLGRTPACFGLEMGKYYGP